MFPITEKAFRAGVHFVLDDLLGNTNFVISDLLNELDHLDEKISNYSLQITEIANNNEQVKNLMKTTWNSCCNNNSNGRHHWQCHEFKSCRQLSAWLGLTPRQNSSGGKTTLVKITKTGDGYIRKMLVMGARSIPLQAEKRKDLFSGPSSSGLDNLWESLGF